MTDVMQYRDFFFPHNPASIAISREGANVTHFCPGRGEVHQRIGGRARRVVCKGCFFGGSFEEANGRLQEFLAVVSPGEPGTLFLPGCEPFLAYLKEVTTEASSDGRVLPYVMTFVEAEAAT
jgi:hypothetical protein